MIRRRRTSEEAQSVPAWVISFTDMVTLLLAFFVMLQALATTQDPELFFQGQGSFKRAMAQMGLPDWLVGRTSEVQQQRRQVKHTMESADDETERRRIIDAEKEQIHEAFVAMSRQVDVESQEVRFRTPLVSREIAGAFAAGGAELTAAGREALAAAAAEVHPLLAGGLSVVVVGRAPQGRDGRLGLSLRRARSAETVLRQTLPRGTEIQVVGAGDAAKWRLRADPVPESSQLYVLLIARKVE